MPFQIRTADGRVLTVHTVVGEGCTRVVVQEDERPAPALEPSDEGEAA